MQDPDGHAIDDARRTGKAPGMATAPPFTAPLLRLKHTASSTPAVLQCEGLQSGGPPAMDSGRDGEDMAIPRRQR